MTSILAFLGRNLPQGITDWINHAVNHANVMNTWGNSLLLTILASAVLGSMVARRARWFNFLLEVPLLLIFFALNVLGSYALGLYSVNPDLDMLNGYLGYHMAESTFCFGIALFPGSAFLLIISVVSFAITRRCMALTVDTILDQPSP